MRRFIAPVIALAFVLLASIVSMAQLNPTTTLALETGNNSSTANSFAGQPNGNASAGNVSKVNVHTLMYPGHSTKMYVNYLPWFGIPDHVSVGYNSADPAQVERQVADMVSRGFDGAILDWFGYPETRHSTQVDKSSQLVLQYAQQHPNFEVAIMMDQGAIKPCANTPGCDVTGKLIKDLTYAHTTFMQSGSYMRRNGRPVVVSFDLELLPVDWNRVTAALPNIMFVFQNVSGFTRAHTGGGYAWVGVKAGVNDDGTPYLSSFYSAGVNKFPSLVGMGSVHKGFNDTIALWSLKRVRSQECGQTWLKGFNTANAAFNSGNQLETMQVVTWNDYEEGTEIESGIDNCIAVNASVSGSTLNWGIGGGGQENTIDHYEVFISSDGQNLQKLADAAAGTRSLNLASYSIPSGPYKLFVKAVGKPSIRNTMSNAAAYNRG